MVGRVVVVVVAVVEYKDDDDDDDDVDVDETTVGNDAADIMGGVRCRSTGTRCCCVYRC
jgi:hypothetical protein